MKELGPATRALLEAAGPFDPPPPEVVDRMLDGVLAKATAAAVVSSATKTQLAHHLGRALLGGKKAKLVAVALALSGGAVIFGVRHATQREQVAEAAPGRPPQVSLQATYTAEPDVAPDRDVAPAPPPAAKPNARSSPAARPRRRAAPRRADRNTTRQQGSATAGNSLKDELALIRAAQAALSRDDLDAASRLAARHARQFPKGLLTEERLGIQALVHCSRGGNGGPAARRLLREMPASPIAQRVRDDCQRRSRHPTR